MVARTEIQAGPLMQAIASVDNLARAWQQVRRNIRVNQRGRSRGHDDISILDFEADWTHQMEQLAEELLNGCYHPLPPKRWLLPKRSGGQRSIVILAVRDRIAQRAVLQVLEPIFEPIFLDCSYGFRPHVGAPHALARVERYRQQGKQWAAHTDIADCFDSIDHRLLLALVSRHIKERAVLELIAAWLQAGVLSDDADSEASSWWRQGEDLLEQAIEWSTAEALRRVEPFAALPFEGDGNDSAAMVPEAYGAEDRPTWLRQRALRGLASNAALLGLAYAKPAFAGARRAAPLLRRIGGSGAVLGTAGVAALASAPLAWRALRRDQPRGALQGGALSPLLANIYLDPFDRAMVERGHTLVRYADDLLLLGGNREEVETALAEARKQLTRLRLHINESKTSICSFTDGITFLGCRFPTPPNQNRVQWTSFKAAEQALRNAGALGSGITSHFRDRRNRK
jgi:RNA-directed DNA polymerase